MFQCAEPDERDQELPMIVGHGREIRACFHNEYARPSLILAGSDFTPTRSETAVSLISLPGIFKQSTFDAKLMKVGGFGLSEDTKSVEAYDLSLSLRGAYLRF